VPSRFADAVALFEERGEEQEYRFEIERSNRNEEVISSIEIPP
jgi:hypothetical protein